MYVGKILAFTCFWLATVAMRVDLPWCLRASMALLAICCGMRLHDRAVREQVRDRINMLREKHKL